MFFEKIRIVIFGKVLHLDHHISFHVILVRLDLLPIAIKIKFSVFDNPTFLLLH